MKGKTRSVVGSKKQVFLGKKHKTRGGLRRGDLVRNVKGKVVSKRMSAHGKKAFVHIAPWLAAFRQAKEDLGLSGFVLAKRGSAVYAKAKVLFAESYSRAAEHA